MKKLLLLIASITLFGCNDSIKEAKNTAYSMREESNKSAIKNLMLKYHAYDINSPQGEEIRFTYEYQRQLIDKKVPLGIKDGTIRDIEINDSVCTIKILTNNYHSFYISIAFNPNQPEQNEFNEGAFTRIYQNARSKGWNPKGKDYIDYLYEAQKGNYANFLKDANVSPDYFKKEVFGKSQATQNIDKQYKSLIDSIKTGYKVCFIINVTRIQKNDYAEYTDSEETPYYLASGNIIDFYAYKENY